MLPESLLLSSEILTTIEIPYFLTDLVQLIKCICNISVFQLGNLEETVQINLLKIMILRNNTTDEAYEFICILQWIRGDVDKTYLIVKLIHMFGTLVKVNNASVGFFHRTVYSV